MAIIHEAVKGRSNIYKIDPREIVVKENWNERTDFGDLEELARSIAQNGIYDPLQVLKNKENIFEIVDGERRLRATMIAIENGADIKAIPCIVVDKKKNELERLLIQFITNEGKRFTPVEEAGVFKRFVGWGLEIEEIAKLTGKSLTHIYERLILYSASPEVKKALQNREITLAEAREIAKTSDGTIADQSEKLADKKVNGEKRKRSEFNFDKVNVVINREFKKLKKQLAEDPNAKKVAISKLKDLITTLEKEDVESPAEVDPRQTSLLDGVE